MVAKLMQQRSHAYTLNKNFKQSQVSLPTIAGMPLMVNIQGAMTMSIKASGKLDMMAMAVSPRNMAIVGSLEPRWMIKAFFILDDPFVYVLLLVYGFYSTVNSA